MNYERWVGARVKLLLPDSYLNTSHWTFKNDMNNVKSYILSYYKKDKDSTTLCIDSQEFNNRLSIWTIHISDSYQFEIILVNHKTIVI